MCRRENEVVVNSVFGDDAVDAAMENHVDLTFDGGESAPVTPSVGPMQLPPTPRHAHSTRMHDSQDDADHETKKARVADHKKQKINQLMQQHEAMIRVVKVGTDEYATMDDYSTELDMNADVFEDEYWCDEDQVWVTFWLNMIVHCTTRTQSIWQRVAKVPVPCLCSQILTWQVSFDYQFFAM